MISLSNSTPMRIEQTCSSCLKTRNLKPRDWREGQNSIKDRCGICYQEALLRGKKRKVHPTDSEVVLVGVRETTHHLRGLDLNNIIYDKRTRHLTRFSFEDEELSDSSNSSSKSSNSNSMSLETSESDSDHEKSVKVKNKEPIELKCTECKRIKKIKVWNKGQVCHSCYVTALNKTRQLGKKGICSKCKNKAVLVKSRTFKSKVCLACYRFLHKSKSKAKAREKNLVCTVCFKDVGWKKMKGETEAEIKCANCYQSALRAEQKKRKSDNS